MVRRAVLAAVLGVVFGTAGRADTIQHARLDRLDRSYDLHADLTYTETTDIDYTLLTARGLHDHDRSSWSFTPGSQTLDVLEAWVDQPDGTRVPVEADSRFTRPSEAAQTAPGFSSSMTTTLLFPQLRPGSRTHVRWRLTQQTPPLLGFNVWIQPPLETAVTAARITIRAPANAPLKWADRDFEVTDERSGDRRVIVARIAATKAEEGERDMVAASDFQPLFLVTTLARPEELGAIYWQASLYKSEVTPEIAALAQRLAGGREGEAAARAVYDWVARNIRYVAVYLDPNAPWIPHRAADVLRAGYGDCKDHVVVMQALLGALGVRAQAALVDWGDRTRDPPLWLPQAFNHAIVYLPDFDRFLNPTDPYARFDSLDRGLAGKTAIIASPDGRMARTPEPKPKDFAYNVEQKLTLDADGGLSASARYTMTPNLESGVRAMVARASSPRDLAERLLAATPEGGFGEFHTSDPRDLAQDFDIVATWKSPHAATFQDGAAYLSVPVGLDLDPPGRLRRYLAAGPRRHGVLVGAAEDSWTTQIALPKGVSVMRLPEDVSVRNEAGQYTAVYRVNDQGLRIERRLEVRHDVFEPAATDALDALLYAPIDDARSVVVLGKARTEASAALAAP